MLNVTGILFGYGYTSDHTMLISSYETGVTILLIHHYHVNVASVLLLPRAVTEHLKKEPLLLHLQWETSAEVLQTRALNVFKSFWISFQIYIHKNCVPSFKRVVEISLVCPLTHSSRLSTFAAVVLQAGLLSHFHHTAVQFNMYRSLPVGLGLPCWTGDLKEN